MSGPDPAGRPGRPVRDVEVIEDRTGRVRPGEEFLSVRRLVLRTVFEDGGRSEPYPCDVVSRRRTDAVAVVLYETSRDAKGRRTEVRVAMKTGVRAPVWLRRAQVLVQPDSRPWGAIAEVVAGMLEPDDVGPLGVERRAAHEAKEEAGLALDPKRVETLGAEAFPSPGVADEKVHFRRAEARLSEAEVPAGDGSAMEEGGGVVVLRLKDAIAACRTGEVPDMKTEVALLRLADAVGYVPSLDAFVEDLPPDLRARFSAPGLSSPGR